MSIRESEALHERARELVRAFVAKEAMPESFDALACDLARFQAKTQEGYARLCRSRGIRMDALSRALDVPAVPTDAFKLTRVASFPESQDHVVFRTSGTTIGARGVHALRDVRTYDEAAVAFGRWALARDLEERVPVLVLGPSPDEAPDSSLTHRIARFVRELGSPATARETYVLMNDVLDIDLLDERIARALVDGTECLLLVGTSFAFVHLLDALGSSMFRLPPKSRVMQTGGFKGRSREVSGKVLRKDLSRAFGIDPRHIVGEYGMTELSSQFYEETLFDPEAPSDVYVEPPWARVVPVDPETHEPVPEGEIGIGKVIDLMNVDSAVSILTADRVRRSGKGFELLGRAPSETPRGCSIAIDEILGRGSRNPEG